MYKVNIYPDRKLSKYLETSDIKKVTSTEYLDSRLFSLYDLLCDMVGRKLKITSAGRVGSGSAHNVGQALDIDLTVSEIENLDVPGYVRAAYQLGLRGLGTYYTLGDSHIHVDTMSVKDMKLHKFGGNYYRMRYWNEGPSFEDTSSGTDIYTKVFIFGVLIYFLYRFIR